MDDRLLDAAVAVLAEHGFPGLTLERVAERVGRSRVTLWRQQVTQEALVDGLLARLTRDYRDAMWPAMTEAGTGAGRLRTAATGLLDVADAHLPLLGVADDVFERAEARLRDIAGQSFRFVDPFTAAVRSGRIDGSTPKSDTTVERGTTVERSTTVERGTTVEDEAEAIFASICWGYVHLRRRLGWSPERARPPILALVPPSRG